MFSVLTLRWIVANLCVSESHVSRAAKSGWLCKVGIGFTAESVEE